MLHRDLFTQIQTQSCNQLVDLATAIEMAGIDTTDQQGNLIGLVIAEYFDRHR